MSKYLVIATILQEGALEPVRLENGYHEDYQQAIEAAGNILMDFLDAQSVTCRVVQVLRILESK